MTGIDVVGVAAGDEFLEAGGLAVNFGLPVVAWRD